MTTLWESGFCHTYTVKLLYINRPKINIELINKTLKKRPDCEKIVYSYNDEAHVFTHMDVPSGCERNTYTQTKMLPMTWLLDTDKYEDAMLQSWDWPSARTIVTRCRYSVSVLDVHASELFPTDRLATINKVLQAIVLSSNCDAIYFCASDKLISPKQYLNAVAKNDILFSALSVRMYQENLMGGRFEIAMDTLGLAALGLPDIQFRINDNELKDSSYYLNQFAKNIFENGDSYQDGQMCTFQSQHWICTHQMSYMSPPRFVLSLNKQVQHEPNYLQSVAK